MDRGSLLSVWLLRMQTLVSEAALHARLQALLLTALVCRLDDSDALT